MFYSGLDVCKAIGYAEGKYALRDHVSVDFKRKRKDITSESVSYHCGKAIYISLTGLKQLLQKNRVSRPEAIKAFQDNIEGLDLDLILMYKEQECIGAIETTFSNLETKRQFRVDNKYVIDLYIPLYNIAVECDEFNHSDREIRQRYIEEKLGCKFVRFNPDEPNFTVHNAVNAVWLQIYKKQQRYIKRLEMIAFAKHTAM